ncbi:MAG: threonine aldolase family protein [Nocardioidaceae bacterium]
MTSDPHTEEALKKRFRAASLKVERRLAGSMQLTPAEEMRSLSDEVDALDEPLLWDRYGETGPVEALEQQVADLLGKPAAAMFPSGVMAQQSVLRVWSDETGSRRIALPALSHLLYHELDGPELLHGFRYERLTDGANFPRATDLEAIPGRLGAALLELPLRDGGYLLPTWDELSEFSRMCRNREIPLHFDGARIWESQPYLGHPLPEIAALADSVYVSFYKGLRGLAGAAVAGPADVIAQTRSWRTRHGGTLISMLPYAVTALRGLRQELPRMAEYHDHALALADALSVRGFRVFPQPPHSNAFRILAARDHRDINERMVSFMDEDRTALTPPWEPADVPGWSWTEFAVGAATLEWPVATAVDVLGRVVQP